MGRYAAAVGIAGAYFPEFPELGFHGPVYVFAEAAACCARSRSIRIQQL